MSDTSAGAESAAAQLSDDRRKHLDHLHATIARMAAASAQAKTWLLPVVAATLGYALVNRAGGVALIAIGATCLFAFLDARYLREERAFRALYRRSAANLGPVFDMNSKAFYGKPNGDEEDQREENCQWRKIIFSWSLAGFYIPVLLVAIVVAAVAFAIAVPVGGPVAPTATPHPSVAPSS